jgi:hypothetical protein
MSSPRYMTMPDYKQAWYLNLLFRSWLNSDNPGYLPNDPERLWMLANARTKTFFQREAVEVMACFQVSADGRSIFNSKLLQVYEKQLQEYLKRKPPRVSESLSISRFDVDSKKTKEEIRPELTAGEIDRRELERKDGIAKAKARGFVSDDNWATCRMAR